MAKDETNGNQGRLTLNGVDFLGKKATEYMPPYTFEYNGENINYTPCLDYENCNKDAWGYNNNNPALWSMNKINTPLGSEIRIEYEEDDYYTEAFARRYWTEGLTFKINYHSATEYKITIRNSQDVPTALWINFEDYFNDTYIFRNDYTIIKESYFNTYESDYKKTSALWGGFSHDINFSEPATKFIDNILEIEAGEELNEFDTYSYESTIRAIEQPYAFERFLKLYHLLELQFDYYIIDKIKNLSLPNDANDIGKLLKNYSKNGNELDKLTEIIKNYCTDIPALETKLNLVLTFEPLAKEIFVNFGNENKPLGKEDKFNTVFSSTSFSQVNLTSLKITKTETHNEFIIKLVSYWIYRIRCSVAHNKIGEYLLSWTDERFIIDFAEPLIKEVLRPVFRK